MPICPLCGEHVKSIKECKVCKESFCEDCGDFKEKICINCFDEYFDDEDYDDDYDYDYEEYDVEHSYNDGIFNKRPNRSLSNN